MLRKLGGDTAAGRLVVRKRRRSGCRNGVWPAEDGRFALGREAKAGFGFSQNENEFSGFGGRKNPNFLTTRPWASVGTNWWRDWLAAASLFDKSHPLH